MKQDSQSGAGSREIPGEAGPEKQPAGEHERMASALEMAIRERLVLRIGRGPITNRVAHLLARARLLEHAETALRLELRHLDDQGRVAAVARASTVASESRSEVDRLWEAGE